MGEFYVNQYQIALDMVIGFVIFGVFCFIINIFK